MPTASSNVRVGGQSGKHVLVLSSSQLTHFELVSSGSALTDEQRRANVIEVAHRSSRSSPLRLLRHRADLLLHSFGVLVTGLELVRDYRRKSAFRWVCFYIVFHLSFRLIVIHR